MNPVVHFEIHAEDTEKMAAFYRAVLGWEITKWDNPAMDYWMVMSSPINTPGAINGGITKRMSAAPATGASPNAFVCTIAVDDVDAYAQKVLDNGGKVAMEAMDMPSIGRLGYYMDIEGNVFGLIKPLLRM